MNIQHIKISNILGIEQLEFDAGQFNVIEARNGAGKTSVLEAIKSAFKGGHDATLLRAGAEKGEVVLVLDDGQEIIRRVGSGASSTVVRKDGKQTGRPAETIKDLADLLSVNPVEFLRAPAKDRVRVLLESMPLEVDVEKLEKIAGKVMFQIPSKGHALAAIEIVNKAIFDERTGVNRAVKEKLATIEQLRAAIPSAPGGVDGDENELQAQIDAATAALDVERERIDSKLESLREAHVERMESLRQQMAAEKASFDEIKAKADAQREKAKDRHAAAVGPIREALAAIRANRDNAAKRQQSLAMIEQMDQDAQSLGENAAALTKALQDLQDYRLELLADLPIPGLEIREGELFREGVPFDRLNTAQQVQIAVEIAKLRAGKLGVVCVDNLELMDSETWEAFRDSMLASGLQMFVTRVGDGEFAIETEGGGF